MQEYQGYQKISVHIEDKVGRVLFSDNPPDNFFTLELMEEFSDVLDKFQTDNRVRCVLFTHEGPDLCHSAGPAEAEYLEQKGVSAEEMAEHFNTLGGKLLSRIIHYPKPTVIAATGVAIGAGAAFYECFDIRLAGESFNYFDVDIYWGAASTWGLMTTYLPLWLGRNKFLDFLYFGEHFTARQLFDLGMVSRVYADPDLRPAAIEFSKRLAQASPLVIEAYKERMKDVLYGGHLDEWRQKEMEAGIRLNNTQDGKNAIEYGLKGEQPPEFLGY